MRRETLGRKNRGLEKARREDGRYEMLMLFGEGNFCGGPIGVVKLLRARGGCLGVIRIRAWKAAKSPGELPNERRSRNARADPGN